MKNFEKLNISKKHFLSNSNDGFDFYERILGDLKLAENNRCENILNPFYGDKNPSFSIFYNKAKEVWCYKDYGDSEYYGDVFKFAATYYEMDIKSQFFQILGRMYDELGIEKPVEKQELNDVIYEIGYSLLNDPVERAEGTQKAHSYYKGFGITPDVLRRFHVWAPSSYFFINKEGELKEWNCRRDQMVIMYEDVNHIKIYQPDSKEFKFSYRGTHPSDFVFGQKQIIRDMIRTKRWVRDTLIITGGEKDVLTLTSLGYDAICLSSETAVRIPVQLESSILQNYKHIVVLYDLDDTGKRCAEQLQKRHAFKVCTLPKELKEKGGKDVSDYIKLGLSIQVLRILINEAKVQEVRWYGKSLGDGINSKKMAVGFINSKEELVSQDLIDFGEDEKSQSEQKMEGTFGGASTCNLKTGLSCQELVPLRKEQIPDVSTIYTEAVAIEVEEAEDSDDKFNTPFLPDVIFDKLPSVLRTICNHFPDKRDRDLVFLSSFGVISSLLPSVKSLNSNRVMGANLNLFISAPAASGKGVANWSRDIGSGIQRYLKEKYEKELSNYNVAGSTGKKKKEAKRDINELPIPVRKSLYIPANTSISKMIELLDANGNFGIMFETEGDTLTGALKTEWGNFSEVIRKCFHHEPISLARRGNDEHIEIERPHLSLVLTGTPDQLPRLIDTVENGFFSRFFFYDFNNEVAWKSQFMRQDTSLNDFFKQISTGFLQMWLDNEYAADTLILFDKDQIGRIDAYFSDKQKVLNGIYGSDILASVNRSCVICQRFCMILTALRFLEKNKQMPERLYISDEDLAISLSIIDTLLIHLEVVFSRLRTSGAKEKLNGQQRKVFDLLPEVFTWKEYCEIGQAAGLPYKTGEKYLRDFRRVEMVRKGEKHGHYVKIVK